MVCCGTKKGVEKLQAIENIFSFTFGQPACIAFAEASAEQGR